MTLIEEIKNTKNGMITRAKEEEKETIKVTILKSMKIIRRKIMMIRKGLGVLQEGIDPPEKIGTIREEILKEETTPLIEGNMLLKEGVGGNTALTEEGIEVRGNIPPI